MLGHGERREQAAALRHDRDARRGDLVGGQARERLAVPSDRAAADAGRREAHDGTHQGRLAHAVTAQQRENFALGDMERHALQDVGGAIEAVEILDLKHAADRDRRPGRRGWS